MPARTLKLGAILLGSGGPGQHSTWLDPDVAADASVDVHWYIDRAKEAEAAKFDLVFIVDSQFITPNSPPHYLNRLEPLTLLSALATATSHIGLVGTATTSFNSPFNLTRRLASLDLISHGRAGWNVVTSGDPGAAGNFGLDEHYDYDTRYGRAHEYVGLARALWDSYEDDAFTRDKESGQFLDTSKQHALHHRGEYFSVAGPLNIERSPQGQPVIFQAGDSDQGRDLGAAIAEGIFTHAATLEGAQAFYSDISRRTVAAGRDPEDIVIMPGISVVIGDTDAEAAELAAEVRKQQVSGQTALRKLEEVWNQDLSGYDPDGPLPDVDPLVGEHTVAKGRASVRMNRDPVAVAKDWRERAEAKGLSIRELMIEISSRQNFIGSAATVADQIDELVQSDASDGFILVPHITPGGLDPLVDSVVPLLQERGVYRTAYPGTTLRDNLGLPPLDGAA